MIYIIRDKTLHWKIIEKVANYKKEWITIIWPMHYQTKNAAIEAARKGLYQ